MLSMSIINMSYSEDPTDPESVIICGNVVIKLKRSLFNSGVGRNNWLSIQIFDLNRRDPVPGSGNRGSGEIFYEYSSPSRDPRAANNPYFYHFSHSRAATRKKIF